MLYLIGLNLNKVKNQIALFAFILGLFQLNGQEKQLIDADALHIIYDNSQFNYLIDKDEKEDFPLSNLDEFLIRGRNLNVYMEWLNPLKYEVDYKDTIQVDPSGKEVVDFLNILLGNLGTSLPNLSNTYGTTKQLLQTQLDKIPIQSSLRRGAVTKLKVPDEIRSLVAMELIFEMHSQLVSDTTIKLDQELVSVFNSFFDNLTKSDSLLFVEKSTSIKLCIHSLFHTRNKEEVENAIKQTSVVIEELTKYQNEVARVKKDLDTGLGELKKEDLGLLNYYIPIKLSAHFNQIKDKSQLYESKAQRLKDLIKILEDSVKEARKEAGNEEKMFRKIGQVQLGIGKVSELSFNVNENSLSSDSMEIKSNRSSSTKLILKRRRVVVPTVSAGVMYKFNESVNNFSTAPNSENQLMVVNDTVTNSGLTTALFLNLMFFPDRDVAGYFQIGVDPAGSNSNILLGIGGSFIVDKKRFGISFGSTFSTRQELSTLSVGSIVSSPLELEKDIQKPKALFKQWYMGLQYNF